MDEPREKIAVVIVAAGRSERFGDPLRKKPFATIQGKAIWLYSAELFLNRTDVGQLVVVIAAEDEDAFISQYAANLAVLGIDLALGGDTRAQSVANGVRKTRENFSLVAVHDAARPCISGALVERVFARAQSVGNVIPATRISSTIKRFENGATIKGTVDRDNLLLAQTPQVFQRTALMAAFENGSWLKPPPTDEAELMERAGHTVHWVEGALTNIKITTQEDLRLAQLILQANNPLHFDSNRLWR